MATIKQMAKLATLLPVAACAIISGVLYILTGPMILFTMWLCAIKGAEDRDLMEAHDAWLDGVTLPLRAAGMAYNYIWQK